MKALAHRSLNSPTHKALLHQQLADLALPLCLAAFGFVAYAGATLLAAVSLTTLIYSVALAPVVLFLAAFAFSERQP